VIFQQRMGKKRTDLDAKVTDIVDSLPGSSLPNDLLMGIFFS